MYEVLDKDTIKIEILPHLSVAKRGYVTKSDLSEVIQCILYKLKTGCQWHMIPVSAIFTGEGFELQKRVCPFPQVVEERRMEKGLGHNVEPLQVFLGHVQRGFGRQPHHNASRRGVLWIPRTQEKDNHQCHISHRPTRHAACHVHSCFGFSQRPPLHLRGSSGFVRKP